MDMAIANQIAEIETDIYTYYKVRIQTTGKLYGGIPKNPEVIDAFVEARQKKADQMTKKLTKAEIAEDLRDTSDEKMWNGFLADDGGIYIRDYHVKAMLKECGNIAKSLLDKGAVKKKVAELVTVLPVKIHFDGKTEPDGSDEKTIHVMTARGPRDALKRADYVGPGTDITFTLKVLKVSGKMGLSKKDILTILVHAQENGLGADRAMENGKFKIAGFEKADSMAE